MLLLPRLPSLYSSLWLIRRQTQHSMLCQLLMKIQPSVCLSVRWFVKFWEKKYWMNLSPLHSGLIAISVAQPISSSKLVEKEWDVSTVQELAVSQPERKLVKSTAKCSKLGAQQNFLGSLQYHCLSVHVCLWIKTVKFHWCHWRDR